MLGSLGSWAVRVAGSLGGRHPALLDGLGIAPGELPAQLDRAGWPAIRARLTALFVTRTRDEWAEVFAGTDACVTPVLSFSSQCSPSVAFPVSIMF